MVGSALDGTGGKSISKQFPIEHQTQIPSNHISWNNWFVHSTKTQHLSVLFINGKFRTNICQSLTVCPNTQANFSVKFQKWCKHLQTEDSASCQKLSPESHRVSELHYWNEGTPKQFLSHHISQDNGAAMMLSHNDKCHNVVKNHYNSPTKPS